MTDIEKDQYIEFNTGPETAAGPSAPCPHCHVPIQQGMRIRFERGEGRWWHDACYVEVTGGDEPFPDESALGQVHDPVDHPAHYTSHPSGIECIQIVEHMGFSLGNAIKYIWRADEKGNDIEDLEKARWYIDREIERRKQ